MDKARVQGTIDEAVGNAKRHVGKWTGDTRTELEGAAQQIKGKLENTVGKLKDAARDAHSRATQPHLVTAGTGVDNRESERD
jgi:uncharacterized protein YjbJ (UPF0337 family)